MAHNENCKTLLLVSDYMWIIYSNALIKSCTHVSDAGFFSHSFVAEMVLDCCMC